MRFKYKVYKLENDEWILVKEFKDELPAINLKKCLEQLGKTAKISTE